MLYALNRLTPLVAILLPITLGGCALPALLKPTAPKTSAGALYPGQTVSQMTCAQLAEEDLQYAKTSPDLVMVNAISATGQFTPTPDEMATWRRMLTVREAIYYNCKTNSAFDALNIRRSVISQ